MRPQMFIYQSRLLDIYPYIYIIYIARYKMHNAFSFSAVTAPEEPPKRAPMRPQMFAEFQEERNTVREVYDPETGRMR